MKGLIWKNIRQAALAIVFLLAVWLVAYLAVGNGLLVPSPWKALRSMGGLLLSAAFWKGFGMTFLRVLLAFLFSFVLALIFAVIAYMLPAFDSFFAPVVSAIRSLPVLAVLLILLSVLRAGTAPVAVAFLSLFPLLYTGILGALSGIDRRLVDAARVCGTSVFGRVRRVYLPLTAPYILRESGAAFSFGIKLVVSAEILSNAAKSLGGMMQAAKLYGEIPQLFALVGVAFLVGLLAELLLTSIAVRLQRKMQ